MRWTAECEKVARSAAHGIFYPGADYDDVLQAARIGVWQACESWRPGARPFATFAYLCARREVLDGLATARRGKQMALSGSVRLEAPIRLPDWEGEFGDLLPHRGGEDVGETVELSDEVRTVLVAIATRLSPMEQEAIVRVLLCGESYEEVGDPKRIDNALHRARMKLRRALA